jgi:hypothetical protein
LRQRRFPTLIAYLVYYPCWWWLEHTRGLHPIHAAGVQMGADVVLLAGASGVGKSTLAVALAAMPGAKLLSDSFVLHSGADVVAVPEPVLLDAWGCKWLGKAADLLRPMGSRYALDRAGSDLACEHLGTEGRATLLVLPRSASKPYVRLLPPREAHRRLSAINLIINDLRRYWAFAAVLEQLVPGGLVVRRETELARLTAGVRCYDVGMSPEMTRAAATDVIMRLLHETPLRALG